jgi:hypothetical protein
MNMRKQILDPLSTLCKIASLSFHENGSKLSIIDNIIEVQKSDNRQWVIRTYRGDSKEHISLLYNPTVKAIQWYIFQKGSDDGDSKETSDGKPDAIKNIMKFAIDGLRKLKSTYKEGNIILALQFLINNLKIATSNSPNIELFEDYNEINFEEDGIMNYDKIKEIWNIDTIMSISNQFTLCNKSRGDQLTLECMLDALNLLLKNTDTKFKKLVSDMNTAL